MIRSMTGFATLSRTQGRMVYTLDIRSVNGRGFELKLRCSDPYDTIEGDIRALIRKTVTRGSLMFSLRVQMGPDQATDNTFNVDLDAARASLQAVAQVEELAKRQGLELAHTRASDILALRGVLLATAQHPESDAATPGEILADIEQLLLAFDKTRQDEGARLAQVINDHLDRLNQLVSDAKTISPDRDHYMGEVLHKNISKLYDISGPIDHEKITQEIAILLVKQNVTEELDRLQAHISAARDMLICGGPIGRKFDFLTQEFNREANTLCSKSQFTPLTKIGLDMKSVIDQIREQIQNIE